jgi:cell division protein FtsI (penicillin-binding protein 3)
VGLKQTLQDFGFGEKTGVDLMGETGGIMHDLPWSPHLVSNISFGHGVAVTPLQMASAYAAIANGGTLKQPFIYRGINLSEEQLKAELKSPEDQKERRVLTTDEAATMRMMLSGVTAKGGTGINARVPGYIVAGKTGTAQKVNPNGRGYLPNTYVSSFAGFIPAQDPRFVIYVVVDSPKKGYYGSQVAAPIFSRVASFAVRKIGLMPSILNESDLADRTHPVDNNAVDDRTNDSMNDSENNLKNDSEKKQTLVKVPELQSLSLREVVRELHNSDIQVKIESESVSKEHSVILKTATVKKVEPAAGEPVPENKTIKIFLE